MNRKTSHILMSVPASINVFGSNVEFAQKVRPVNYKLFQVAEVTCKVGGSAKRL